MRTSEVLQGLRMMTLRDVMSRWEADELSQLEASELLGMNARAFRRRARRCENVGEVRPPKGRPNRQAYFRL
jgi:hypothetical protein